MNPIIVNCFLLYFFVIFLSLLQSRFRIVKDDPITYVLLITIVPFLVLGKAKGIKTWTALVGIEIFVYTMMLCYTYARRIVPKVNEGYIFAYTLFHWYLLFDAVGRVGYTFWNVAIIILSLYPTILIVKSAFEHRRLQQREKMVLYYWFLFIVFYTFVSQVAMHIISPVLKVEEVSIISTLLVFFSAVQLYFVSTTMSLLWVAIPLFHLEKSGGSFSVRWKNAMKAWRKVLHFKLDNYIEYQINGVQVLYISVASAMFFYIDASYTSARPYLIILYTIVLPLFYFYFKAVPEENLEEEWTPEVQKEKLRSIKKKVVKH